MPIGSTLRHHRTTRGLTLDQLSQATAISLSRLSKIENDDARVDIDDLEAIAKAYEIKVRELVEPAPSASEAWRNQKRDLASLVSLASVQDAVALAEARTDLTDLANVFHTLERQRQIAAAALPVVLREADDGSSASLEDALTSCEELWRRTIATIPRNSYSRAWALHEHGKTLIARGHHAQATSDGGATRWFEEARRSFTQSARMKEYLVLGTEIVLPSQLKQVEADLAEISHEARAGHRDDLRDRLGEITSKLDELRGAYDRVAESSVFGSLGSGNLLYVKAHAHFVGACLERCDGRHEQAIEQCEVTASLIAESRGAKAVEDEDGFLWLDVLGARCHRLVASLSEAAVSSQSVAESFLAALVRAGQPGLRDLRSACAIRILWTEIREAVAASEEWALSVAGSPLVGRGG